MTNWYVDSSVILRALVNGSEAVKNWLQNISPEDALYGSRMLELEVRRVTQNAGKPQTTADAYLDRFHIVAITDDLINDAIKIPYPLGGADSIHVATALRLRSLPEFVLATHDAQMAHAVKALGLAVTDPVTDDPNRPPVA